MYTRYTHALLTLLLTTGLLLTPAAPGTNAQDSRSAPARTGTADAFAGSPVMPLTGIVQMGAGVEHTCVLSMADGVKCWGSNQFGQLGDGSISNQATPVDVVGLGSGVAAIAAGMVHTCVLTTSGGVKCWGGSNAVIFPTGLSQVWKINKLRDIP